MYSDEAELDRCSSAQFCESVAEQVAAPQSTSDPEAFRLEWLGRKQGRPTRRSVTSWLERLRHCEARNSSSSASTRLKSQIAARSSTPVPMPAPKARRLSALDVTLPGISRRIGVEHPLVKTMAEIVSVFQRMGYSVGLGPEVETDFYNFESLNFPPNHPARDTQDTLVVADQESKPLRERLLMRTHTSPVQIRSMLEQEPPLRIVIPGCRKSTCNDAGRRYALARLPPGRRPLRRHGHHVFRPQGHARPCDESLLRLGRFKQDSFPSFFPFTEPSADVQISCIFCGGKG